MCNDPEQEWGLKQLTQVAGEFSSNLFSSSKYIRVDGNSSSGDAKLHKKLYKKNQLPGSGNKKSLHYYTTYFYCCVEKKEKDFQSPTLNLYRAIFKIDPNLWILLEIGNTHFEVLLSRKPSMLSIL